MIYEAKESCGGGPGQARGQGGNRKVEGQKQKEDARGGAKRCGQKMGKEQKRARRYTRLRKERLLAARQNGTHKEEEWIAIVKEFDNRCVRCGASHCGITKDHIVPISLGGHDGIDNLQPLCAHCNTGKHEHYDWKAHRRTHGWSYLVPRVKWNGRSIDNPGLSNEHYEVTFDFGKFTFTARVYAFGPEAAEWIGRRRAYYRVDDVGFEEIPTGKVEICQWHEHGQQVACWTTPKPEEAEGTKTK